MLIKSLLLVIAFEEKYLQKVVPSYPDLWGNFKRIQTCIINLFCLSRMLMYSFYVLLQQLLRNGKQQQLLKEFRVPRYLCLISRKSIEKKRSKVAQNREMIWLIWGKKVFVNTFVADLLKIKVQKWNRSKLPIRFEVVLRYYP